MQTNRWTTFFRDFYCYIIFLTFYLSFIHDVETEAESVFTKNIM